MRGTQNAVTPGQTHISLDSSGIGRGEEDRRSLARGDVDLINLKQTPYKRGAEREMEN